MKKQKEKMHKTSIGGAAVMEGVMMRGPYKIATAVRKPDGEIAMETKDVSSFVIKYKLNKIPIVRGVFSFFESMVTSITALMYSADFVDMEGDETEEEPGKFDAWLEKTFGDKLKTVVIWASLVISLFFSIGLFMLLPTFIAGLFRHLTPNTVILNLIEGIIKIAIFLGYLTIVSFEPDIKRVFQYHGAEHKTIFCYESGLPLTVENVREQKRLHPRCGTSFLILVMIISILVFSLLPGSTWNHLALRILYRLLLLPIVAGLSYEAIKWAGRSDGAITRIISWPGMMLQRITTREPDDSMIEVAITSMTAVIPENKEDDKW